MRALLTATDNGNPSQDVAVAAILFLVDGKLVLLQPTTTEGGELKYEMRIIAQNVEYYVLMRDNPSFNLDSQEDSLPPSPSAGLAMNGVHGHDLKDSLWFFDGRDVRVWVDMQDVLSSATIELGRDLPTAVKIEVDFYPLSALINKGILFGVESELVQRRDISFGYLRFGTRVSWGRLRPNAHFADTRRRISSSLRYSAIISHNTIPLQPYTYHTTTSSCYTFHMHWRSYCMMC